MSKYIGNIITRIPTLPTPSSAKGIWQLDDIADYKSKELWPNLDVTMLLHGNGANNSTTFTDSSSYNLSLTRTGTPVISTAQSKFGGASMYFTGTSQYLNVPSDYSSVAFGTGDFTVEFWSYIATAVTGYQFLFNIAHTNGNFDIRYGDSGFGNKLQVGINTNSTSSTWSCALTKAGDAGVWKHIAFTRSGTTCRLFVNGTIQNINNGINPSTYPSTSFTSSTSVTGVTSASIGGASTHTSQVYLDEFRITKGIARYTANFTTETAEFP